jgi:hypothetical protein
MNSPAFNPWEGPFYSKGLNGVKLLVVGEALYSGDKRFKDASRPQPGEADWTEKFVRDLAIKGPGQHRPFWTKVTKLLLNRCKGEPISTADRTELWNRIAFYNYIQWWMPSGRTKPTQGMWEEAREPFLSVLKKLSPRLVLVLGLRLYENLPPVSTQLVPIAHPSSRGFTYERWCGKIVTALDAANTR